jgi:hypothetical protein
VPGAPAAWLRLDERTNALDNLEMADHFIHSLPEPIRWKWAIIALHQALYGFAVAAVQSTDSLSVLKNPDDPESHLISIWEALRRAKDSRYLRSDGTPLIVTEDEEVAIQRLVTEFRNSFEHFKPAGWSVDVSGMPRIVGRVVAVVHRIAIGTQSVRFDDADEDQRLRDAFARLGEELNVALPVT